MLLRASFLSALLVSLAGCEPRVNLSVYSCADPEKGHLGPDGEPDPCHDKDADAGPDAGLGCDVGEFVHWSAQWEPPMVLWVGTEEQAPECPKGPATIAYQGRADLVAPAVCEVCTCAPPTGSCALPSKLTASTMPCGTPGGTTSFNAPNQWNGSCDTTTKIPGAIVQSVTIEPLAMTESGCASGEPIPAKIVSLHWEKFARGCDVALLAGPVNRSICLSDNLIPPGFALCIFHEGEYDCPEEPGNVFVEQHVFYQGVQDDRQCSACACGAPTGSACAAMFSAYKGADLTCNAQSVPQIHTQLSSVGPSCENLTLPGQGLGSKSASPPTYLPGQCPALGGDASGSATMIKPSTLCCLPS